MNVTEFLEKVVEGKWYYAVKRLSGNDTGLTGGHQSGIYLPRWFFEEAIPSICRRDEYNPRAEIEEVIFPNVGHRAVGVKAIYYNSKYHPQRGLKKPYDEFRITGFGGAASPFQNPDNTGVLAIIAVRYSGGTYHGIAWVCESKEDEALIESWIGRDVLPGEVYGPLHATSSLFTPRGKKLAEEIVQPSWAKDFPTGEEVFRQVVMALPMSSSGDVDKLLVKRRELEFAVFKRIEELHVAPRIAKGFKSVDEFFQYSLAVANRRKSRTGRSLELNLAQIFRDSEIKFETQAITENRKRPDFLFPSSVDYANKEFPAQKLQMMAAKTCCKDRWRQVMSEADRIAVKHLFTLQEGISENQYAEMKAGNIALVVPAPNLICFPAAIQQGLATLKGFVALVAAAQQ